MHKSFDVLDVLWHFIDAVDYKKTAPRQHRRNNMATQSCVWSDIFDDQSRANLERGLIATGIYLLSIFKEIYCLDHV